MKKLYSAQDPLMIGHLKNVLETCGIGCIVKNTFLSSAAGEIPPIECWPELWVVEDEKYAEAREVLDRARAPLRPISRAWKCGNCDREIEGQFSECWNCGYTRSYAGPTQDRRTESQNAFQGRCHCGNLELSFESSLPAEQLSIRACSCSFCRAHGARSTSDPQGHVRITVHDSNHLIRYRFGLKTADFLVCGRCGIYVAAVLTTTDSALATINVNILDCAPEFSRARTVSYEGESVSERIKRRQENWSPAVVTVAASAEAR